MADQVLLSVRPHFANALLSGTKTVEVRRRFPLSRPPGLVLLYSSSPERAVLGTVELVAVTAVATRDVWEVHGPDVGIDRASLDGYLAGTSVATLLHVRRPDRWPRPVPLVQLRQQWGMRPPQSWRNIDLSTLLRMRAAAHLAASEQSAALCPRIRGASTWSRSALVADASESVQLAAAEVLRLAWATTRSRSSDSRCGGCRHL